MARVSEWFGRPKKVSATFKVEGFRYAGTGSRDYGEGIVRISEAFITRHHPEMLDWPRHQLIRIRNSANGQATHCIMRILRSDEDDLLCLEYDDRLKLKIFDKGERYKLDLVRARSWDTFRFYWNHPSNLVRIDFKLSVYLTLISIVLGFLISLPL